MAGSAQQRKRIIEIESHGTSILLHYNDGAVDEFSPTVPLPQGGILYRWQGNWYTFFRTVMKGRPS